MKITVTGSLGYVSTPLITELIKSGHTVKVISSKAERKAAIGALGATAPIGSMDDDFLRNTPLAKRSKNTPTSTIQLMKRFGLAEKEETVIIAMVQNLQAEYLANMDKFSQDIIISQVETLLNYADRFYHRQFLAQNRNSSNA